MSSSRRPEEIAHQVVSLSREGMMSRRAIARALGVSRNTVKEILTAHAERRTTVSLALPQKPPHAPRPSKFDGHKDQALALLERFPTITAQRVFEELRLAGFCGGYTAVKVWVKKARPKKKPPPSLPTEVYGPGKMAECDGSPYTITFTSGAQRTLQAFGYALPFSHRKFFRFYKQSDHHALCDGHVEAFTAFGGAAERCKYDNQKTVVLRWEGEQPIYNLRFIDFATYYEFRPLACRPAHPHDKPRVERSFWELEKSFFNGREFKDETDLAAQLTWWQKNVCDTRPQKKEKRSAFELFAIEQPALRPLPQHPYDTARVIYRLCDIEGYIAYEGNRYSLPYEHVTDILPVRVTQTELYVYAADLTCVARHELYPKGAAQTRTLPEHRPAAHKQPGADLDQLSLAFARMGDAAREFLAGLVAAQPRSAAYHARRILLLRDRYDTASLVQALAHARAYAAFEHHAVERILFARAAPRRLDEYIAEATAKKLEALLDQSTSEPRELTEYDALPCWAKATNDTPPDAEEAEPCPAREPTANRAQAPSPPTPSASGSEPISND